MSHGIGFTPPLRGQRNDRLSKISPKKKARFLIEYVFVRTFFSLVQMLPIAWCESLASWIAWCICDVFRVRARVVEENLSHVFPDKTQDERRELARAMWRHLILMAFEIAHAPRKIHDSNWRNYVYIRDKKIMTQYFLDWRPVVLVTGHFGNFELAVYMTGILGIPTYAIVRPLDNPWLQKWIAEFRESRGQFMFPSQGSATRVQEVLDAGGMLSLLGDQHAGTKGCWIDFLGKPAACHKALALFTLSGEAPMIVTYAIRRERMMSFEIGCNGIMDPLTMPQELKDVRSLTQWYNQRLEELIKKTPDQYWWLHRRWKEKTRSPDTETSTRGLGEAGRLTLSGPLDGPMPGKAHPPCAEALHRRPLRPAHNRT